MIPGGVSPVITRPMTRDGWNPYDPDHRIRRNIRPGITAMRQSFGRYKITGINEAVKPDREQIENRRLWPDLKLLFRTGIVVLTRRERYRKICHIYFIVMERERENG
ncbi:MAG: sugar transferase [Solobacterium sp.]|nr:sugar transferase [Solobacterium sp.]